MANLAEGRFLEVSVQPKMMDAKYHYDFTNKVSDGKEYKRGTT